MSDLQILTFYRQLIQDERKWQFALHVLLLSGVHTTIQKHHHDRLLKRLIQIQKALINVCTDQYGRCQDCEQEISLRRLKKLPYSIRCFVCQRQSEETMSEFNRIK